MLVADHWPRLVHGVIAEAPSSIGYSANPGDCPAPFGAPAWTLDGKPVAHTEFIPGAVSVNRDGSVSDVGAFEAGLGLRSTEAARIPVGGITGPVLLISGGNDELWPSDTYADQIMAGVHADRAIHRHLNYPLAGHVVLNIPYSPPTIEEQTQRGPVDLGGGAATDEAAYESDWPDAIRFITSH